MDRRTTVVAAALGASLVLLGGCGSDEVDDAPATPTPSASAAEPTPTATPPPSSSPGADDLAGTWRDDAADWTVHLGGDGRFVVDYQGINDFLVGSWARTGDQLSLVGDDGNTQVGRITDAGLVFDLGTLTRR